MQIEQFLRDAILELKDVDEASLVSETSVEDLQLDSLDYVEIQVGIKRQYGVTIEPEKFANGVIKTLGDLGAYIRAHVAQTEPQATAA
jgi:acyl carrier protein